MSLRALLLLSILTVEGSGCDDFMKTTVRNLQDTIGTETTTGFPQVFPKNYIISHHFNDSAVCDEPCCVFSSAVLLSNSWIQLLQHLSRVHLKHHFISELILTLNNMAKEKFQEIPDLSTFPSVQSSPEGLLFFTSSLLQKWLDLNCAFGEHPCTFIMPNEEPTGSLQDIMDESGVEGKTDRQLHLSPTNGHALRSCPGYSQWTLFFIWIATCVTSSLI